MLLRRSVLVLVLVLTAGLLPFAAQPVNAVTPGTQVDLTGALSPPANLSTSGDFATDTFSDPWDFSNAEDIIPIVGAGVANADAVDLSGGVLTAATRNYAELRLLMNWSQTSPVLPWGHRTGSAQSMVAATHR